MQKAFGKLKEIDLNPKVDLEQAIKNVKEIMKKRCYHG